jgi:hypothetical protein
VQELFRGCGVIWLALRSAAVFNAGGAFVHKSEENIMGIEMTGTLALAAGAAWASGINLYAALLMFGILGSTGSLILPPDLQILTNPLVIFAAGFMYLVEFFADKTPGVDSVWDVLHTFIRIPAGAALAAAAVGELDPAVQMAAFIIGGGLATGTHLMKTSSRMVINTSPEPVTNWTASFGEDVLVLGGLWAALNHPTTFLVLLGIFVLALIWLLPKLFRTLRIVLGKVRRLFGSTAEVQSNSKVSPDTPVPLTLDDTRS